MFTFAGSNTQEIQKYIADHKTRLKKTFDLVQKYTKASGKILDIGAKPFVLSFMLCEAGFDYTGVGVYSGEKDIRSNEIEAKSIAPASNKQFDISLHGENNVFIIPLIETNIELNQWPFKKASFNTLIWTETMEHLTSDPCFAWHQANLVLPPGGKLIFSVPNALYWIRAVQLLLGKNIDDPYSWHGPFGRHNRLYSVKEISKIAELHGFKRLEMTTLNFLPEQNGVKQLLRKIVNSASIIFGNRKGKTIVAVFEKVSESKDVIRPSFLYH